MAAEMITRSFTAELSLDGRTVEGLVVPYDVPAEVCDEHGPTPVYREVFTETSFARQLQGIAAGRARHQEIGFTLDHRLDLDRHVGYMADAESTPVGLRARFALYPTANLELVRAMLAESHTGLSVEAALLKSRVRPDGVVERRVAQLVRVAAVPTPAYAGAGITALRADAGVDVDEIRPTPILDAVAARWGFTD